VSLACPFSLFSGPTTEPHPSPMAESFATVSSFRRAKESKICNVKVESMIQKYQEKDALARGWCEGMLACSHHLLASAKG